MVAKLSVNSINQFEELSFHEDTTLASRAWCKLGANQLTRELKTLQVLVVNTFVTTVYFMRVMEPRLQLT